MGNISLWGYLEVEITSTYANQNSVGKLTKLYAVGSLAGGNLLTNESRVSDVMGTISGNISLGELSWDSVNLTYIIPISHIVNTANVYTVKVRMFTNGSCAKQVFDSIAISPLYNLPALAKNHVSFNGLPMYADNATALSSGLTSGALYRTAIGAMMIVF